MEVVVSIVSGILRGEQPERRKADSALLRAPFLIALLVLACGCTGGGRWAADSRGWITYSGSYHVMPDGGVSVDGGSIAKSGATWNGRRVSFSFYEDPAVDWRFYFFDEKLKETRLEELKKVPAVVNGKVYERADEAPTAWAAGVIIRLRPVRAPGNNRTGLLARSKVNVHPNALTGETKEYDVSVNIRQLEWNEIVLDFSNGHARCFVNGVQGKGFRYDPEMNGPVGFHVTSDWRLRIKNLTTGPIPVEKPGTP